MIDLNIVFSVVIGIALYKISEAILTIIAGVFYAVVKSISEQHQKDTRSFKERVADKMKDNGSS